MDCGKIIEGLVGGVCDEIPIGGTATRAVIINYADVDKESSTFNTSNTEVIESIAMKEGKKGYMFETIDNVMDADSALNVGTYFRRYDHSVTLRIFKKNIEVKQWMASLKDARVIIVLENRASGEGKWDVYGWDSGLKLSEDTFNAKYTDDVVFAPKFASDDTSKESTHPKTFYITGEKETEDAILSIVEAV